MKKIHIVRYEAECGKRFSKKSSCEHHETVCKCWRNPKFKTCITCEYGDRIENSNGMEHEPQNLHEWLEWNCSNSEFIHDEHFTPAHEKAADLCINCPIWKLKIK